jgi:DNA repair protein RadD
MSKTQKAKELIIQMLNENQIFSEENCLMGKDLLKDSERFQKEFGIAYGTFTGVLSTLVREGKIQQSRGKNRGYFISKDAPTTKTKDNAQESEESDLLFLLTHDYEHKAVQRLCKELTYEDFTTLLDGTLMLKIIDRQKRSKFDKSTAGNKSEIAAYLVKTFGRDLFLANAVKSDANDEGIGRNLRELISKKMNVKNPKRFVRGGDSAIEFIKSIQFPLEYAGESYRDERLPYLKVKGKGQLHPLKDYQTICKNRITYSLLDKEIYKKGILCLPTGAGKTRVMVESIWQWNDYILKAEGRLTDSNFVIWIAQSDELCEQAVEQFSDVWATKEEMSTAHIIRFWTTFDSDKNFYSDLTTAVHAEESSVIMITTYQKILNLLQEMTEEKNIDKITAKKLFEALDLVVIDEAHYAGAESYPAIINAINKFRENPVGTIGMTATPFRHSNNPEVEIKKLENFFGSLIFPYNKNSALPPSQMYNDLKTRLQSEEILAKENAIYIETNINVQSNENIDDVNLSKLVSDNLKTTKKYHIRQDIASQKIKEILTENKNASVLYFGLDLEDAFYVNSRLLIEGVNSGFISGATSRSQRNNLIKQFKSLELNVLCNCQLLTTGFDAPKVTDIVIGRPIMSPVLFTQIIGRGLRGVKYGGTEKCNIYILKDKFDPEVEAKLAATTYIEMWDKRKLAA